MFKNGDIFFYSAKRNILMSFKVAQAILSSSARVFKMDKISSQQSTTKLMVRIITLSSDGRVKNRKEHHWLK